MLRKMNIVMIICIIISGTALIAGEIVDQVVATINLPDVGWGYTSEDWIDFTAPGDGKYQIRIQTTFQNWTEWNVVTFTCEIEDLYPRIDTDFLYIQEWQTSKTLKEYVDLEEGVEYTFHAKFYNSWITCHNTVAKVIYKYSYDPDIMVSLDFSQYLQNPGSSVNLTPLIETGDGTYFDFTGEAKLSSNLPLMGYSGVSDDFGFTMNVQYDMVDRDFDIHPFWCDPSYDFTQWTSFDESDTDSSPPEPFLSNISTNMEFKYDFDNGTNEISFQNREFRFEYAPNYANIAEEEITVVPENNHPKIEWPQEYADFFIDNNIGDYFDTEIWRKRTAMNGNVIEGWNCFDTNSPIYNYYVDETLYIYDPEGGGMAGVRGIVYYKIKLIQTSENPNFYEVWKNDVEEQIDDYSPVTEGTIYGDPADEGVVFFNQNSQPINDVVICNNNQTQIAFTINDDSRVNTKVSIYNIKGQLVKDLIDSPLSLGKHNLVWNGKDNNNSVVSEGVYLLRISRSKDNIIRKIILIR